MRNIPSPAGLHLNPTVLPASHVSEVCLCMCCCLIMMWGPSSVLTHRDITSLEKKDEISNKLKHNEGRVSEHKVGGFIKSAAQFHRQVKAVNVIIQTTSTVSESVHGETTQCTSSKFCYY